MPSATLTAPGRIEGRGDMHINVRFDGAIRVDHLQARVVLRLLLSGTRRLEAILSAQTPFTGRSHEFDDLAERTAWTVVETANGVVDIR